jgi:hypothetical protein
LALTTEAVRVTRPGGRIVLNYRSRSGVDVVLLPLGGLTRAMFRIPRFGTWLAQRRWAARLGWQANRLHPDDILRSTGSALTGIELWRNPASKLTASGAQSRSFEGINPHHYWLVATVG